MLYSSRTEWFDSFSYTRHPTFRLFCFPYAGGGVHAFQGWSEKLPEFVDFCPIHLPGRGKRFGEKMNTALPDLIEEIASAIAPFLDIPFAFFGHSMGAMIAYELSHELRRMGGVGPAVLYVSGRRAPHINSTTPPVHDLPESEFIFALRKMNGTPLEVLNDADLMQLLLPVLRTDFALSHDYEFVERTPLQSAIIALGGISDLDVPKAHVVAWKEHTIGRFSASMLPGDHFFIHQSLSQVLLIISKEILRTMQAEVRS